MYNNNRAGGRRPRKRKPRSTVTLRVDYRKDTSTNYYNATAPLPDGAALPSRVYLTEAFAAHIAKNCDRMLSRTASAGMLTGLRRRRRRKTDAPGSEVLRGNIAVYGPTGRVYRDLDAILNGDTLTLTLY